MGGTRRADPPRRSRVSSAARPTPRGWPARATALPAAIAAALSVVAPAANAQFGPASLPSRGDGLTVPGLPQERGSALLPGVRASATVSDNPFHRSRDVESSGYLLEVSPYLTATTNGPRAQGSVTYALRAFHVADGDRSERFVRHSLRAGGNALLAGDWLGIQGSAATYHANTSPWGLLTDDPAASTDNVARVSVVSVAPYVTGRLGTFAEYRAQYALTRTETSSAVRNVLARQDDRVFASLRSGPQFVRWGWSLSSSASKREFPNDLDLSSTYTVATVYYVFSPELRVGASANHLYVEGLTNERGKTRGWGPGVTVDWAPSRRTTLRFDAADQYYGTSGRLSFAHRAERWTLGLDYTRAVFNSNNAALLTFNPASLLSAGGYAPTLNPLYQQLVAQGLIRDEDDVLGAGLLSDALLSSRTVAATLGYRLPRGALALTAYRAIRETLLESTVLIPLADPLTSTAFGRYESRGVTLALSLSLDARTTLRLSAGVRQADSLVTPDESRLTTLRGSISTRLDARTSASAGVARRLNTGLQGVGSSYDENLVFGTVDLRF